MNKGNVAFVRMAPGVRDRLRKYCEANGQSMGFVVSKVLGDFLDITAKGVQRREKRKKAAHRVRKTRSAAAGRKPGRKLARRPKAEQPAADSVRNGD